MTLCHPIPPVIIFVIKKSSSCFAVIQFVHHSYITDQIGLHLVLIPLLTPKSAQLASNFFLQYHPWIKHSGHDDKPNDHQLKKLLTVRQILFVSTLWNV